MRTADQTRCGWYKYHHHDNRSFDRSATTSDESSSLSLDLKFQEVSFALWMMIVHLTTLCPNALHNHWRTPFSQIWVDRRRRNQVFRYKAMIYARLLTAEITEGSWWHLHPFTFSVSPWLSTWHRIILSSYAGRRLLCRNHQWWYSIVVHWWYWAPSTHVQRLARVSVTSSLIVPCSFPTDLFSHLHLHLVHISPTAQRLTNPTAFTCLYLNDNSFTGLTELPVD